MSDGKSDSAQDAKKNVDTAAKDANTGRYNFLIRTVWTFVMIAGFFVTLASGHLWSILLIVACQIATFKECIAVTGASSSAKNLPLTKTLNWYLLITTIYSLNGELMYTFFAQEDLLIKHPILTSLISNHKFICYCLYLFGFVLFVCTLRRGFLKYQFASLCITHMVLLLVVFQGHLIISNVLSGIFWFLLPCGLVIVNDIFAYLCGKTFGRTKLIEISPKKTLEGFLGAWFFTALSSIILTRLFTPYRYLICPAQNLSTNFFTTPLNCELNSVFVPHKYRLPPVVFEDIFGVSSIVLKPIYFHTLNLATFASLFAPFGGFFASGLKRTFQVKDFGNSIPGHGGITDRIDCQFIMGSFTNLYYETFISERRITVETILTTVMLNLSQEQLVEFYKTLSQILIRNGIVTKEKCEELVSAI